MEGVEAMEGKINCVNCGAEVPEENKFCSECGNPIDDTTESQSIKLCPKCNAEVPKDNYFCTKCGTKVVKGSKSIKNDFTWPDLDEIRKGFNDAVDKVSSDFDKTMKGETKKNTKFKPEKIKGIDNPNPGYLVCNSCGGVYRLKSCESPDDFSEECECSGKIIHMKNLPKKIRPY
jgi:ribosomal protein L40E